MVKLNNGSWAARRSRTQQFAQQTVGDQGFGFGLGGGKGSGQ
ncbi:hypothetical protein [Planomicrobium okeanokoites]